MLLRLPKPEGFVCVAQKFPELVVVCVVPFSQGCCWGEVRDDHARNQGTVEATDGRSVEVLT